MGLAVCPATIVTVSCWKLLTESPTNPSNPTMYGPAGRLLIVTGWPGVTSTVVSFVTVRITRPEVNGTPLVGSIRNASAPVPVGGGPWGLLQDRKGSAKAGGGGGGREITASRGREDELEASFIVVPPPPAATLPAS